MYTYNGHVEVSTVIYNFNTLSILEAQKMHPLIKTVNLCKNLHFQRRGQSPGLPTV